MRFYTRRGRTDRIQLSEQIQTQVQLSGGFCIQWERGLGGQRTEMCMPHGPLQFEMEKLSKTPQAVSGRARTGSQDSQAPA